MIYKKYLFASGENEQQLQEEIDLQVTDSKLNFACVRPLLDPLYKNVLPRQNLYEIVFKDISKFDK